MDVDGGSLGLSARGHDRVLKVARTIADLEGAETISAERGADALRYRHLDHRWRAYYYASASPVGVAIEIVNNKPSCLGRMTLRKFGDDEAIPMFVTRIVRRFEREVDEFLEILVG